MRRCARCCSTSSSDLLHETSASRACCESLPHAERRSTSDIGMLVAEGVMRVTDQHFIHRIIDASVIDAGAEAADFKGCGRFSWVCSAPELGREWRFDLDREKRPPDNRNVMKTTMPLVLALLCLSVA